MTLIKSIITTIHDGHPEVEHVVLTTDHDALIARTRDHAVGRVVHEQHAVLVEPGVCQERRPELPHGDAQHLVDVP